MDGLLREDSYTLAQIGVCTTVPGPQSLQELDETLRYLDATEDQRDFSTVMSAFQEYREGACVYCNHCLPCPAEIYIGRTIRLLETAGDQTTRELRAAYEALPARASDCIECGVCGERCPFGVDVIPRMGEAAALFESSAPRHSDPARGSQGRPR